jgi:hypothetical protein
MNEARRGTFLAYARMPITTALMKTRRVLAAALPAAAWFITGSARAAPPSSLLLRGIQTTIPRHFRAA